MEEHLKLEINITVEFSVHDRFDSLWKLNKNFPNWDIKKENMKRTSFIINTKNEDNFTYLNSSDWSSIYKFEEIGVVFFITYLYSIAFNHVFIENHIHKVPFYKNIPEASSKESIIKNISKDFNRLIEDSGHIPDPSILFNCLLNFTYSIFIYELNFSDFIFNWEF